MCDCRPGADTDRVAVGSLLVCGLVERPVALTLSANAAMPGGIDASAGTPASPDPTAGRADDRPDRGGEHFEPWES
jgi:hypothetical protein